MLPAGRAPGGRPFGVLQVELTTSCPLCCRMCPRSGQQGWRTGIMPIDRLRRLAAEFHLAEAVVLSGWGEPLAYPHLEEAVRLVAEAGARPGFVTSGQGLFAERAGSLVGAGLDFMGFSLAGTTAAVHERIRVGSTFEEVKEAVRTIVAAKIRLGSTRPRLHLVYLMLRENLEDLPALPALAQELGVPEVMLTHLILMTSLWQGSQSVFSCGGAREEVEEREEILRAVEVSAKKLQVRLTRPPLLPTGPAVCGENPLANLYVSVEGRVSPCVYLQPPVASGADMIFCGQRQALAPLDFGNVDEELLKAIWAAGPYREFRESFRRRLAQASPPPIFGGRRSGRGAHSPPPMPCRTCHKILGF
ncbi:MAG TPA: radical SAM/SPASM domain-containing protein [Candidatus Methanoperedens sp.]|nr:radical SAM/SPASM domain-containing protein [Candidatus Methanoperedens sp.]